MSELICNFERGKLEQFHHSDHVRMAFEYLCRYPALEALGRFSDALRRFAAAQGKPNLYHETITWAYVLIIRQRMAQTQTLGIGTSSRGIILTYLSGRRGY